MPVPMSHDADVATINQRSSHPMRGRSASTASARDAELSQRVRCPTPTDEPPKARQATTIEAEPLNYTSNNLEMVARELVREFENTGHLDDPDVQDFVRAVTTTATAATAT